MDILPYAKCTRPYALLNFTKMTEDYDITHAMKSGRDYEMAVIDQTKAGLLILNDKNIINLKTILRPYQNKG